MGKRTNPGDPKVESPTLSSGKEERAGTVPSKRGLLLSNSRTSARSVHNSSSGPGGSAPWWRWLVGAAVHVMVEIVVGLVATIALIMVRIVVDVAVVPRHSPNWLCACCVSCRRWSLLLSLIRGFRCRRLLGGVIWVGELMMMVCRFGPYSKFFRRLTIQWCCKC